MKFILILCTLVIVHAINIGYYDKIFGWMIAIAILMLIFDIVKFIIKTVEN